LATARPAAASSSAPSVRTCARSSARSSARSGEGDRRGRVTLNGSQQYAPRSPARAFGVWLGELQVDVLARSL
jgi:hypothetical protein